MMHAHTPGPWYYSGTGHLVGGPDRIRVADCGGIERTAEVRRANARLIAAAPSLLAALETIHAQSRQKPLRMNETPEQTALRVIRELARAALVEVGTDAPRPWNPMDDVTCDAGTEDGG